MTGTPHGARAQVTRLLALVPYLQNRGAVALREIAADFGVSTQQVRRDLNVLWFCGLPGLGPGDLIDLNFESFEDDADGRVRALITRVRLSGASVSSRLTASFTSRDWARW